MSDRNDALGSLVGFLSLVMPREYAFRWNTAQAARYLPARPPQRLPAVPRAIVAAILVTAIPVILSCPQLLHQNILLFAALACAASTLAWLNAARHQLMLADSERTEEIEEFLADADAPVPTLDPKRYTLPSSLTFWNLANITFFLLVMARMAAAASDIWPLN